MLQVTSLQLEAWVAQFIWPFFRLLALFLMAPVFSHTVIPNTTKIAVALAITLVIAPLLPAPPAIPLGSAAAWMLVAEQMLIGFAIGFSLRIVFAALELAGDMIGLQMGIGFATFIDPQNSVQTPLIGSFLGMLATLLFLGINGHLLVLNALVESFVLVPVGSGSSGFLRWEHFASLGSQLFALGLQISMPLLATMLLCNLALGVMARAAPQLNLFSIGFPLTVLTGLVVLVLFLPHLGAPLEAAIHQGLRLWQ